MKRCPQCGQAFNDETLKFCLLDGAPLVAAMLLGDEDYRFFLNALDESDVREPSERSRDTAKLGDLLLMEVQARVGRSGNCLRDLISV